VKTTKGYLRLRILTQDSGNLLEEEELGTQQPELGVW
jgi:hypothetical protein